MMHTNMSAQEEAVIEMLQRTGPCSMDDIVMQLPNHHLVSQEKAQPRFLPLCDFEQAGKSSPGVNRDAPRVEGAQSHAARIGVAIGRRLGIPGGS
jgi:hypothetical protein